MDFALSEEQQRIREAIAKLCTRFPDDYWLERDRAAERGAGSVEGAGGFPADFHQAMARDGCWASRCRRSSAARAWASPKPRS
jgi:acyl-CoA dehydrogenase